MKQSVQIFIFLLVFIPGITKANYGEYQGANYVSTLDAKTIIVDLPNYDSLIGEKIRVRLNGIFTPSIKGKCKNESNLAKKSKAYIHNLLDNSDQIDLINLKRGVYFQIIADIIAEGLNLADHLVEKGYAVKKKKKRETHDWCKKPNVKNKTN